MATRGTAGGVRRASAATGTCGSLGYAHRMAPDDLWSAEADRFAGALLIAEMLGWCDERVRQASWSENYFDPQEMQSACERYELLARVLCERWGEGPARLFEQSWRAETLSDCATFGEWLVALPADVSPAVNMTPGGSIQAAPEPVRVLFDLGRRLEEQGLPEGALEAYRQAQAIAAAGEATPTMLAQELALIARQVEAKLQKQESARQAPVEQSERLRRQAAVVMETPVSARKAPHEATDAVEAEELDRRLVRVADCLATHVEETVAANTWTRVAVRGLLS